MESAGLSTTSDSWVCFASDDRHSTESAVAAHRLGRLCFSQKTLKVVTVSMTISVIMMTTTYLDRSGPVPLQRGSRGQSTYQPETDTGSDQGGKVPDVVKR